MTGIISRWTHAALLHFKEIREAFHAALNCSTEIKVQRRTLVKFTFNFEN